MNKIPTIYQRDFEGTLGPPGRFLLREPHPDCDWVFAGEGVATRKMDGTCVMISDDYVLMKRHEVKIDRRSGQLKKTPDRFVPVESDPVTGATVGWVPVDETNPADKYILAAFDRASLGPLRIGTYELVGPHINGNPEGYDEDTLVSHDDPTLLLDAVPTEYFDLRDYLLRAMSLARMEGVVWHHPDGRMAKVKARDFEGPQ